MRISSSNWLSLFVCHPWNKVRQNHLDDPSVPLELDKWYLGSSVVKRCRKIHENTQSLENWHPPKKMVVLLCPFQNGWFAGSILLFGSAPSRQRTCQTLRKDKSSPQKYFGQGDMLVPRFLSWQTNGHEMWWDSDVPCCCFCLYVRMYIYIYKTYSLLILKFAGGFPYMVWKLDLHRDSTSAEKPRDFAPKKGHL